MTRPPVVAPDGSAHLGGWSFDLPSGSALDPEAALVWSDELRLIFEVGRAFRPTHQWLRSRIAPGDREPVDLAFATSISTSAPGAIDHRIVMDDGRVKFLEQRWQHLEGRLIGTCRELACGPQAEVHLKSSQALLRIAGQVCLLGGWMVDVGSHRLSWSEEVCAIHDLPKGSVPTLVEGLSYYAPEHRAEMQRTMDACERTGTPYDLELPKKTATGRQIWVRTIGEAVRDDRGKIIALQGAIQDITARKEAELELARTHRALQMLSRCNETMVRAEIEQELIEQVCALCVEVGGYRMAWVGYALQDEARSITCMATAGHEAGYFDGVQISWNEAVHEGRGPGGRTIRSGKATLSRDIENDPDFIWRTRAVARGYRSMVCLPLRDGEATFGLLGLYASEVRDTVPEELALLQRLADDLAFGIRAQRARAGQLATQRTLAQQAALLDQATDAIFVRDLTLGITLWNRGAQQLYGWDANEVLGRSPEDLFHAIEARATVQEAMTRVLADGAWSGELQTVNRAGQPLTVAARWTLLRDEHGAPRAVLTINSDVTEKKKLEAQFLRAQRMQSIGTLAGGIAHDLNNMLAPILLSIEVLQDLARNEEDREVVRIVEQSAQRATDLVRQLLTFARGAQGDRQPVSPGALLDGLQKLIRDTFPKSISATLDVPPGTWAVLGDSTQLHQVLMNLCVNARDAMPDGGLLTLTVENVTLDEAQARSIPEATAGAWVRFQVKDTGTGISTAIRERIFEPFFTTKAVGKGTGLGLSTSLSIVKGHGGFIDVHSQLGQGTTFTVHLPGLTGPTLQPGLAPAVQPPTPGGAGELVLLVDDEPGIRETVRKILVRAGYAVLQAINGADALAKYQEHREAIAVVLTDLAMPIMDGRALASALLALDPQVRIICTTGFASKEEEQRLAAAGISRVLHKPSSVECLLETVHSVLQGSPRQGPAAK